MPIVIITGASKGLGLAMAHQFAAAGYSILACARSETSLYEMVQHFQNTYPNSTIKALPVDMSIEEEAKSFGNWCLQFGTPDIVINNAGNFIPGSIHNEAEGVLEKMITTNLYSAYHLTRTLLPSLITKKSGHIFNICSIASLQAYSNGGSYSISKFALLGFSKNLREELKPHHIKVTSVLPGAAFTDSWLDSGVSPERIMEANDIAKMIFSCSQLSVQAVVEEIILRPQLGDL